MLYFFERYVIIFNIIEKRLKEAEKLGFDCVSTTLSGYTPYSKQSNSVDFELLEELVKTVKIPVICEGRINTPEELKKALIEKCESEGILYAMVAIDRRTKEVILPDTLQGALKHPEYLVCTCKKVEDKYIVEEITKT